STSYQAMRSGLEASPKRYRYTGKERDDETGLYYHGARYYASWIGRWTSADPISIRDGINVFVYSGNRPINHIDPDGKQAKAITGGTTIRTYDENGRVASVTHEGIGPDGKQAQVITGGTTIKTYDKNGRVASVTHESFDPDGTQAKVITGE